jgi:hypothetical protein
MPGFAGGGSFALSWAVARGLRFELGVVAWPFGVRPTSDGDARFRAAQLELHACPQIFSLRGFGAHACAGVWGGALHARSELVARPAVDALRPLGGALALLGFDLDFGLGGAFALRARAGVSYQLVRDRFTVLDDARKSVLLHRVAPITPHAALELVLQL